MWLMWPMPGGPGRGQPSGDTTVIRPRSQVRAALAALAISVLAIGSMTGVVEAKPPMAVTFHASSDSVCVTGVSNRKHISVDLYRIQFYPDYEQHLLQSILHVTTHADHSFRACGNDAIKPGMAVFASNDDANESMSWFIPTMTMRIDRVTDVVRGSHWAGVPSYAVEPSYALTLRAYQCSVITQGSACPRMVKRTVTPDPTHHYRTDLSSTYDLKGSDEVTLTYRSTYGTFTGNTYKLVQWTPFMGVEVGDKDIASWINPKQTATYTLRSGPTSTSVTATAGRTGQVTAAFSVYPDGGYQVSSDFATDAVFVIPSTHTTVPIDSHGNQSIKTHCFAGLPLSINWEGGGAGYAVLTADSHGRATLDLATYVAPGFHLASGSIVRVHCISDAGDTIGHGLVVP